MGFDGRLKEFFYRIRGRRNFLLKTILIVTLLTLSSFVVVLLPQLINPHILSKHLSGLAGAGEEISTREYYYPDVELKAHTNNPLLIHNFNQTVEQVSLDVYGVYLPKTLALFVRESTKWLNETSINPAYAQISLIGVTPTTYNSLRILSSDNTSAAGAIHLTELQNTSLSSYSIEVRNQNTSITANKVVTIANLTDHFPFLAHNILSQISYYPDEFGREAHYYPCFILKIDEFIAQFESFILQSSDPYFLQGFLEFEEYQKEIMAWTLNAPKLIDAFEKELIAAILLQDPSAQFLFGGVHLGADEMFVSIAHSFIRGLQFTIWAFSIIFAVLSIGKIQNINTDKEFRVLLSGKKWFPRILHLFSESLFLVLGGSSIALLLLYPLLQLQALFGIDLNLTKTIALAFGIVVLVSLSVVFATFVDFELYLRRVLYKESKEKFYKPFSKVPKFSYGIVLSLIFLFLWIINRNLIFLLTFAIFIFAALLLSVLATLLARLIIHIAKRTYRNRKRKENQRISPIFALLKLWKNKLNSRFLLYSIIISVVSCAFLFTNFIVDAQRSEFLWYNGGEIELSGSPMNATEISQNLQAIPEIIDFTEVIRFNQFSNSSNYYAFALINDEITVVDSSYQGERLSRIVGINSSDYFDFFSRWNKRGWLIQGQPSALANDQMYVSEKFQEVGFDSGDSLTMLNDSLSFTIQGIIDDWPGVSSVFPRLTVIMDYNSLRLILEELQFDYQVTYKIHTTEKDIEWAIERIVPLMEQYGIDELEYLDYDVFKNIRIVFLKPIVVIVQMFILIWLGLFVYSNIDDINQSSDAKNLGLLAFSKGYLKPLRNFKIFEGSILYSIFLLMLLLLYSVIYGFFFTVGFVYELKALFVSRYTWFNILFLIVAYPVLLTIQGIVEYYNLRRMNLSLIYRHPE